jgi:hypothetical protein
VTDGVVQSAELRARAVEAARAYVPPTFKLLRFTTVMSSIDADAEYTPINLAQALQNINNRLDELSAMAHNNRILTRNAQRRAPQPYLPLRKTVGTCHIPQSSLHVIVPHNLDCWSWSRLCTSRRS